MDQKTIKQRRLRAWWALGKAGRWNSVWLGEDFLQWDELAITLYKALQVARKGMKKGKALETVAAAMHRFEELYDVGADGKIPGPKRPPEITAELREKYGEIIED